jgi:hypothetical protein
MHSSIGTAGGVAVFAGLAAWAIAGASPLAGAQSAAAKRNYKDQGEYNLFSQAIKDAGDPAGQVADLETWVQQYPDSDFKDVRTSMLAQAYGKLHPPQPAKVLEYAAQIMSKDLKAVFDDPRDGKTQLLQFLNATAGAAGAAGTALLPNPTADQADLGWAAAQQLKAAAAAFFAPGNKPAGTSEADWSKSRATMEATADRALLALEIYQAEAAMRGDPKVRVSAKCRDIAEPAYRRALADYPDQAYVSYKLALAFLCQQKESPEKVSLAVYEFVRAAVIDPTLGSVQPNAAATPAYADKAYVVVHGSTEGLAELKQLVKRSALPPDGFRIMPPRNGPM